MDAVNLTGQGTPQIAELVLALTLASVIGLEREFRQKSAGLRTHTLIGLGAALFMLVSKYGFSDVLEPGRVVLDPSRVAAQIVSGIGFLGAGLIFVRRDLARGLTTAAATWFTAAVGSAAGAGLWLLAIVATAIYLVVVLLYPFLMRALPRSSQAVSVVRIKCLDGGGRLSAVLQTAADHGFAVDRIQPAEPAPHGRKRPRKVEVSLHVHGRRPASELASTLRSELGVVATVGEAAGPGGD